MRRNREFEIPDFTIGADNVYRTKHYIVAQMITKAKKGTNTYMLSEEIFYKRTPKRDRQFDFLFADNMFKNGKRLISTLYSRKYVD